MDLTVNPYSFIPRPKFGDKEQAQRIKETWAHWRNEVTATHKAFAAAKDKGISDPAEFSEELSGLYVRYGERACAEACRRLRLSMAGQLQVGKGGELEWEESILSALRPL